MENSQRFKLGVLVVLMGVTLAGCGNFESTTDQVDAEKHEATLKDFSSESSSEKEDAAVSSSESSAKKHEDSTESTTAESSTSASHESEVSATSSSETSSSASSEAGPSSSATPPTTYRSASETDGVPKNKVPTEGDSRIWGNRRTKRYYTPAQNYKGYRPRNAVPFSSESEARANGYQPASRRPR